MRRWGHRRFRGFRGCSESWLLVTAAVIAGFLLALIYPAGLLMLLLGAVIACIVLLLVCK